MKIWNKFLAWLRDDEFKLELNQQKKEIDNIYIEVPENSNGCTWKPEPLDEDRIPQTQEEALQEPVELEEPTPNQIEKSKKLRKLRVKKTKDVIQK